MFLNFNDKFDNIRLDGQIFLEIFESVQVGVFIGMFFVIDVDGDEIVGYEIVDGSDFFVIENDGGIWKVCFKVGVDYEIIVQ